MKLKELYLGKCVQELTEMGEKIDKKAYPRILVSSMGKLLKAARDAELVEGDQEKAYVFLMRYCTIFNTIINSREYSSDKTYYDSMLNRKEIVRAMDDIEKLQKALSDRYEEREARALIQKTNKLKINAPKDREPPPSTNEREPPPSKQNQPTPSNSKDQPRSRSSDEKEASSAAWMSVRSFAEVIRSPAATTGPKRPILFDVRPDEMRAVSKIKFDRIISLAPSDLFSGITIPNLSTTISKDEEAFSLFKNRGEARQIFLMDEESAAPGSAPLRYLKAALFQWDAQELVKSEPMSVEGGFNAVLEYYPTLVTNAQKYRDLLKSKSTGRHKEVIDAVSIRYPDLDARQRKKKEEEEASRRKLEEEKRKKAEEEEALRRKKMEEEQESERRRQEMAMEAERKRRMMQREQQDSKSEEDAPSVVSVMQQEKEKNKKRQLSNESLHMPEVNRNLKPASKPPLPVVNRSLKPSSSPRDEEKGNSTVTDIPESQMHPKPEDDLTKAVLASMPTPSEPEPAPLGPQPTPSRPQDAPKPQPTLSRPQDAPKPQPTPSGPQDAPKPQPAPLVPQPTLPGPQNTPSPHPTPSGSQNVSKPHPDVGAVARSQPKPQPESKPQSEASSDSAKVSKYPPTASPTSQRAHTASDVSKVGAPTHDSPKSSVDGRSSPKLSALQSTNDQDRLSFAVKGGAKLTVDRETKAAENEGGSGGENKALPPGWERIYDARSQRHYYVDLISQRTSWQRPTPDTAFQPSTAAKPPTNPSSSSSTRVTKTKLKTDLDSSSSTSWAGEGGKLKRSSSQPNLAPLAGHDEEEASGATAAPPMPSRDSKPRSSSSSSGAEFMQIDSVHLAHMQPEYGTTTHGLTGLRNLGNSCYMNSVLQALANTKDLVIYIKSNSHVDHINRANPAGHNGEIAEEFAIILRSLWSGKYRTISPSKFKQTVGRHNSMFASYEQQDSQEFLLFLLDGLHEDFNSAAGKKNLKPPIELDDSRIPCDKRASLAWDYHTKLNESFIVNMFQGQFKSTVKCLTCDYESITFDVFMYLSLQIPSHSRCLLMDCVSQFTKDEKMTGSCQWHCSRCKTNRDAVKTIDVWRLPPYLLIHLKRFSFDNLLRQKKNTMVDFPLKGLQMKQCQSPTPKVYDLYAVSNHYGSMESGHYTAFCLNPVEKRWHKFDDEIVSSILPGSIRTSAAYILFYGPYQRCD